MKIKFIKLLKEAQVHGAVRLAERRWRWLWIIAILLLLVCAIACVFVTIDRYLRSPTYITRLESTSINIPFPSVIVCPELDYPEYKMDQIISEMKYPTGLNSTYIRSILRQFGAFFSPDVGYKVRDLERIQHLFMYNDIDVETAGRRLTPSCEEILIKCRWRNRMINCSDVFQMELTGDGFCCVFNGRSLSREIREFGIHRKKVEAKWFTTTIGFTGGLVIAVNQSQNSNDVDRSYKWLAVQNSQHFVEVAMNGTPLNPLGEQWIGYLAHGIQITEDARSLSDNMRRCHLASKPLKYFPYYNKNYCILECEIARTLQRCHCVRAVHPRPLGATRCLASSLLCAHRTMVSYDSNDCDCPRTCDGDEHSVMTSSNQLINVAMFDPFYEDLDFKKVSVVRAYILRREKTVNSLRCYFSAYDLFAQLGGVFNVFFGCSILTVLELIQLTWYGVKAWNTSRNKYKKEAKGLILTNVGRKKKLQKKNKDGFKIKGKIQEKKK